MSVYDSTSVESTNWSTDPTRGSDRSLGSVTVGATCFDEATGVDDAKRAPVEVAHRRVDDFGQPGLVVHRREELVGGDQRRLACFERSCRDRRFQVGQQPRRARQRSVRGAEPLRVWPVLACEHEVQPHQLAHEARRDQSGADLVADLGGAPDERLFLRDALPLAGEDPAGELVGIPLQSVSCASQCSGVVVIHRAANHAEEMLLRREQPVDGRHLGRCVASDGVDEPVREGGDFDVVHDGVEIPAVPHRPTFERLGKAVVDRAPRRVEVGGIDEHNEAQAPAMVGGTRRIEAQHLRPPAEPPRAVRPRAHERPDDLVVEPRVELEVRDELGRHFPISYPGAGVPGGFTPGPPSTSTHTSHSRPSGSRKNKL